MLKGEKIDDILSQLAEGDELKESIEKIRNSVNHFVADMVEKVVYHKTILDEMNRKDFALQYKNKDIFPLVMKIANEKEDIQEKAEQEVKKFILKETSKKEKAEKFIEKINKR